MNAQAPVIGAFHPESDSVICLDCYTKLEEEFPFIMPDETHYKVDTEAYPDGFTCDGCQVVILPPDYLANA